ncbi:MAG: alanine racemase, partial [Hyphomicrobiales bacterium]
MDITSIGETLLDSRTKGIPGTTKPFALADIAAKGWNVLNEDMPLPLMVLKRASMDYNIDLFADYLTSHDLSLAPHGKTTMSPQIFNSQLEHGAWGICAATVNQMQVMRHHGVKRIVLANQLVGKSNLKTVAAELAADPDFQFFCFIDSAALLDHMSQNLAELSLARPLNVLIEIGATGGRTGMRTKTEALALIQQIAERPRQFRFCGLSAFEGALPGLEQGDAPVRAFADLVLEIAKSLPAETTKGIDEFILSGGGSAYFDIIADRFKTLRLSVPVRVLLRSGCYVTNDHGGYEISQEQARLDPSRHW